MKLAEIPLGTPLGTLLELLHRDVNSSRLPLIDPAAGLALRSASALAKYMGQVQDIPLHLDPPVAWSTDDETYNDPRSPASGAGEQQDLVAGSEQDRLTSESAASIRSESLAPRHEGYLLKYDVRQGCLRSRYVHVHTGLLVYYSRRLSSR